MKHAKLRVISWILLVSPVSWLRGEAAKNTDWVPTWAIASAKVDSQALPAFPLSKRAVSITQIVHLTLGGSAYRVVLSNELGEAPLEISFTSAELASQSVPLTFHGATGITIPAGKTQVSDPVNAKVAPFVDLTISMQLPVQTLDGLTVHAVADEVTELYLPSSASADSTRPTSLGRPIWFFLKEVDVQADAGSPVLVAFGDSITNGNGSTVGLNHRYPDILARRLADSVEHSTWSVLDQGIGGNRVLSDVPGHFGVSASHRFDRDVLNVHDVKEIIFLEGINDIINTGPHGNPRNDVTAAQIFDGITQLAARAHERGIGVFVGTLTPAGRPGVGINEKEQMREAVNDAIRHSDIFDGIIDFDAALRDPLYPDRLLPAFDSGDHLHPNDAGYAAMGGLH